MFNRNKSKLKKTNNTINNSSSENIDNPSNKFIKSYSKKQFDKIMKKNSIKKIILFLILFSLIIFIFIFIKDFIKRKKSIKIKPIILSNESIAFNNITESIKIQETILNISFEDLNNKLKNEEDLNKTMLDFYNNITFKIIAKNDCVNCSFFTYYINYLGCLITSISSQRIPIMELSSFPNIFNEYNNSFKENDNNPWETFFYQPFNLTYEDVIKNAKTIEHESECIKMVPDYNQIYSNKYTIEFYHHVAKNYMPIRNEIMEKSYCYIETLFNASRNVLGILAREKYNSTTSPLLIKLIEDVKNMDNKHKYDYIFLVTEDDLIVEIFIKEFDKKLKFLVPALNEKYNYEENECFAFNKNISGIEYQKLYLINIVILSNCIDIISPKSYEAAAAYILSGGFRNSLFYSLSNNNDIFY